MSDTLKRAEELLAGITSGEWRRDLVSGLNCDVRAANGRKVALCWGLTTKDPNRPEYKKECDRNVVFIAAAPSLVRDLVAEVKTLREERDSLKDRALRFYRADGSYSLAETEEVAINARIAAAFELAALKKEMDIYLTREAVLTAELTSLRGVVEKVREEAEEVAAHWGEHTTAGRLAATILARLPEVPQ